MTDVTFRDLNGIGEFRQAEELQRIVWGEEDTEDPADLMMVIQHEGGLAGGAFAEGRLLGYVFAFPTRDPQVQHSHRLAVHPDTRGLGLGLRLKWYQRQWCLDHGIAHVRWTYDPLRVPNAALNINRLGAVATTYLPDYYGEMEGINKGAPSDRLLADWLLDTPRVAARAKGTCEAEPDAPAQTIALPADFGALLESDPDQAIQLRLENRRTLQAAFAQGLQIRGFDPGSRSYLLYPRS